ncbi:MAG: YggS family pyridoxal phosphate-dependent enzyme [Clostridia bacterium]|nr:YggS family pyridoxal phosphate-dependent enzyme [Clostridia bacterium]
MIEENVKSLLNEIPQTNPFGERVTLVAAIKLQQVEDINRAICAGVTDVGDNHVQEFKDKYEGIIGNPKRHFIGHLQTNKVKYLIGKVDLYHSVDRLNLAEEISKRSKNANVVSNVLLQVNIGCEESKGGFDLSEIDAAYIAVNALPNLKIEGLMAMLPFIDDEKELRRLATLMSEKYDYLKAQGADFKYLCMGMSGDWKLGVECGANVVRIGTTIFGKRNYAAK